MWYPGTINRGFLLTASRVITMIIFENNHLQGATRQGAGKVIQAGAGQVTFIFDEKSYFLLTLFSADSNLKTILARCWRIVSDPLNEVWLKSGDGKREK